MKYNILVLPGDGIGIEVVAQVCRLIDWLNDKKILEIEYHQALVGGACYDVHNVPILDETIDKALKADAVILGCVGGPKWSGVDYDKRPEVALLKLREKMQLFANIRPARCFDALVEVSSLKKEIVKGLDIVIVRELTGGIYFGEPRGIEELPDGNKKAVNTQVYQSYEIRRIAKTAFELAGKRKKQICSVEKSNVMETGLLWRQEVTSLHQQKYQEIKLTHMLADNCAMQLVRNPKQFDVIVTDNLFGDILSDVAAMLTGSLGMLPSASLGLVRANGRPVAMYEPIHGSAPDIAGKGVANPLATILSFTMALRYSFHEDRLADIIEAEIIDMLNQGVRTPDIAKPGQKTYKTTQIGEILIQKLEQKLG